MWAVSKENVTPLRRISRRVVIVYVAVSQISSGGTKNQMMTSAPSGLYHCKHDGKIFRAAAGHHRIDRNTLDRARAKGADVAEAGGGT